MDQADPLAQRDFEPSPDNSPPLAQGSHIHPPLMAWSGTPAPLFKSNTPISSVVLVALSDVILCPDDAVQRWGRAYWQKRNNVNSSFVCIFWF